MPRYDHREVEGRWQDAWERRGVFAVKKRVHGDEVYVLDMFPYPSSDGLHVGHPEGYTASDIVARYLRMKGKNVLHPMGWDAFGLPAENAAIKKKTHPRSETEKNVKNFKRQIKSLGFSYDWSREMNTTDPGYYKWTQWIFLQLFKRGLAYEAELPIWWCPKDKTGLANEEVVNGKCERCGTKVERKMLRQWVLKITAYAERLLKGLEKLDWPESIKLLQRNWIGRSEGAEVVFEIASVEEEKQAVADNVRFVPELVPLVLNGSKFKTYRFFKPKRLKKGDRAAFINDSTGRIFAFAKILNVEKKKFIEIPLYDDGHEPDASIEARRKRYEGYYEKKVANETPVWIYTFSLEEGNKKIPKQVRNDNKKRGVTVFTTRPDTLFGATYLVLSPEHPLVDEITTAEHKKAVKKYKQEVSAKSDLERTALEKEKTGVFTGAYAINPVNNEKIPVWIADYVLMSYGTGAIMAVPAHDERDFAFAKKYNLPIREVVIQKVGERRPDAIPRDGAAAVIMNDGKVLILYNTRYKTFVLVSGGYEKNETPEQTIKREIQEETGYTDIAIREYLGEMEENFYVIEKSEWRRKFHKCYRVELLSERKGTTSREEYEQYEIRWMDPEEAIEKIAPAKSGEEEFIRRAVSGKGLCFTGEGTMVNSDQFNGLPSEEGRKEIVAWLAKQEKAKPAVQYKLRDWVFSRQRYWGEPIPLVHCPKHGVVPIPEDQLPVVLPSVERYEPTGTGESPLAGIKEWVNTTCPLGDGPAKRETNTMPQWAGSCWYYIRFTDPHNDKAIASDEAMKVWLPVDLYVGGAEHAVLHLLYARFWHMVLYDVGAIPKECGDEPFVKLKNQGLILGEDGEKMSKSRGNVINPDPLIEKYGADSFRMYEMFMGPFEDAKPWNTNGLIGVRRFLERVWKVAVNDLIGRSLKKTLPVPSRSIHHTVKRVTEDIEEFHFNTAISDLMIFFNGVDGKPDWRAKIGEGNAYDNEAFEKFLKLLLPFAPHLAEELWHLLGHRTLLVKESWPTFDESKLRQAAVTYAIQVNGKLRGTMKEIPGLEESEAVERAKRLENVSKYLKGKPKKVIFVKDRLINFVV